MEAFRRLKCSLSDLATAAKPVVALDQACGYSGRHWWADMKPPAQADGRVLPNALPSPERLIQASVEVEERFVALGSQITSS
jgi:hypothetical protein